MPTALELGPTKWRSYMEQARKRLAAPDPAEARRRDHERLLDHVREAARLLKSRFQARRVVLLGSLAHQAWFAPDSDVDLAVEGLAGSDYWEAWRVVEEAIEDRPVDLIEIEHASQGLRQAIARHGIEL